MKKRIKVILLIFILLMLAAAGIFVFQNGGKFLKLQKSQTETVRTVSQKAHQMKKTEIRKKMEQILIQL